MTLGAEPDLSIVIVNFRTPKFVTECLSTLLPELDGLRARVVIVDNHSEDNSAQAIGDWLLANDRRGVAKLLLAPANGGFAAGNNFGIRSLRARNYLLLNSDTLVRPGAIAALMEMVDRYPEAGLFSPRLEWPDSSGQESCFRFHSPYSEFIAASMTGIFARLLARYVIAMPVQDSVARPQWTSFACVLVRHDVFDQIGLLDDGYFMYFEDVEFCLRARRAGWDIVHDPKPRVVHLRGGSSPVKERTRTKRRLPKYFFESRTRFFYQRFGWWGPVAANLCWLAGRAISLARQLLGRSDKMAIEKQWLDIWTNWRQPLRPYTHHSK